MYQHAQFFNYLNNVLKKKLEAEHFWLEKLLKIWQSL